MDKRFELPEATGTEPGTDQDFKAVMAEAKAAREAERAEAARLEAEKQAQKANSPKAQERAATRQRVAKHRQRHDPAKLREAQRAALDALSADQREALQAQREECFDLTVLMADALKGIAEGRVAGDSMVWPDCTYRMVKQFVDQYGLVKSWVPDVEFLTQLSAEDFDQFDDQNFIRFGVRTRIPDFIFFEFCRYVDQWCRAFPDSAEPDIAAEVRQITDSRDNKPQMYDGPSGTYSQKENDRIRAEKEEFEREQARYEAQRIEYWNKQLAELKQKNPQPIAFFNSEVGGQQ